MLRASRTWPLHATWALLTITSERPQTGRKGGDKTVTSELSFEPYSWRPGPCVRSYGAGRALLSTPTTTGREPSALPNLTDEVYTDKWRTKFKTSPRLPD